MYVGKHQRRSGWDLGLEFRVGVQKFSTFGVELGGLGFSLSIVANLITGNIIRLITDIIIRIIGPKWYFSVRKTHEKHEVLLKINWILWFQLLFFYKEVKFKDIKVNVTFFEN